MNTIIEKIRAEIERRMQRFESRIEEYKDTPFTRIVDVNKIRLDECTQILRNINTLQEQPVDTSEDERIRQGLISYLKADMEYNPSQSPSFYTEALAYLGRQLKEQPLGEDFDLESDRFFRKLPLDEYICEETFDRIARHFAQWGAEHAKIDEIPVSDDLDEAAKKHAHCPFTDDDGNFHEDAFDGTAYRDFIAGAKWQKEQMMKEANKALESCDKNTASYKDAFFAGVDWKEREMMKEAVEGEVLDSGINYLDLSLFDAEKLGLVKDNKVKLIIVKED